MDESIHGVYVGLLSQELKRDNFTEEEIRHVDEEVVELFDELLENEIAYTREIYDSIGLTHEVIDFVKYNANKALANLGYDPRYEHDKVNKIVLNGLDTHNLAIDFFSQKSDKYKKATVEAITDDDFYFEG
ncbi:ribonucleotide-diphosphate reductase subunit beta [Abyssicoccus albus]|uniref:Ribonucleotide reductase small subunit n=1 Tax=Abyssicoccus albus TaxID=1817405 RepID=A0A3N5BY81_9BACL|nr:ribonucleotide-diphosphate reductase subunit beta [Abyssicoccus albus]RPF54758.1 ribonucleotide reductase small subunit [Abyssicoccus albus]